MRQIFGIISMGIMLGTVAVGAQTVPHGHYYAGTLLCDNGYRDVGGRCEALPPVTHGHYYMATLLCDNGYRDVGGQCEALAAVTHGYYYMATLLCDNGYRDVGGRCEALPPVTNGHYYMATLLCNNGYRDVGGRCEALPPVTNGYYYMATLLCDDGYRDVAGRCERLSPVTSGRYVGDILVCEDNFVFFAGGCQRAATTSTALRVDPAFVARSRPAPPVNLDELLTAVSTYRSTTLSRSGSTYDPMSGNNYQWVRSADGTTEVHGMNLNTGSLWTTTIKPDGSMSGFDSKVNMWRYDGGTGLYINYGTGKMCVGTGAARTCF